jgi:hypothetical protein
MEEDIRKELKEIREECMELRQDIHNINTRHIPPNILSKLCCLLNLIKITCRGRRGRDHMVVGFTTTYAFVLAFWYQLF